VILVSPDLVRLPSASPVRLDGHGPARASASKSFAITPSPTQRCISLGPRYRYRRRIYSNALILARITPAQSADAVPTGATR
jgi:hypothetical protein